MFDRVINRIIQYDIVFSVCSNLVAILLFLKTLFDDDKSFKDWLTLLWIFVLTIIVTFALRYVKRYTREQDLRLNEIAAAQKEQVLLNKFSIYCGKYANNSWHKVFENFSDTVPLFIFYLWKEFTKEELDTLVQLKQIKEETYHRGFKYKDYPND